MSGAPPANPIDVFRAFEVVAVGWLGRPFSLADALAYQPAMGRWAIVLTRLIASIRRETHVAVETLTRGIGSGHKPEEDAIEPGWKAPPPKEENPEEARNGYANC
jgi:hypothetical protein